MSFSNSSGEIVWATFETDRVLNSARIFHMGMVWIAGAVTDPNHMTRSRVMIAGRRDSMRVSASSYPSSKASCEV